MLRSLGVNTHLMVLDVDGHMLAVCGGKHACAMLLSGLLQRNAGHLMSRRVSNSSSSESWAALLLTVFKSISEASEKAKMLAERVHQVVQVHISVTNKTKE